MGMNIIASFNDTTMTRIENLGTVPAKPIITVTFVAAASEFKIESEETAEYLRVVNSFIAGDILVIDCTLGSVTVNGVDAEQYLELMSTFFTIPLDSSRFIITPSLGISSVKIDFQAKYL